MNPASSQLLASLRAEFARLYGPRLARVVLFGSRARGEARPDSDYDVAIFVEDLTDRWAEFDRIEPILTEFLLHRSALIQALPYDSRRYDDPSSLMRNIREEGIEL